MPLPRLSAESSVYKPTASYSTPALRVASATRVLAPASVPNRQQLRCYRQCFRRLCGWWGRKCDTYEDRKAAHDVCTADCGITEPMEIGV